MKIITDAGLWLHGTCYVFTLSQVVSTSAIYFHRVLNVECTCEKGVLKLRWQEVHMDELVG